MSTLNFRNARIFVDGYELTGDFNELAVEFKSEIADATTFGDSTRTHRGTLSLADITGKGLWNGDPNQVAAVCFAIVGTDDKVISVFANGLTEGGVTDEGFSMKGVLETWNVGGAVGVLLPFDFAIRGRGIAA